jgi:NAD-dependent dihydropyrimidine dehydrogenase PreA subunit
MAETVYEKLAAALGMRGGAVPAVKCKEFLALLQELFTPKEAELAIKMPVTPFPAETFAKEVIGGDPDEVRRLLETMADRGTVFTIDRDGMRFYTLMPLVPGIFEMQFLGGEVSERTKKLARLFDDYFVLIGQATVRQPAASEGGTIVPFARVIPVEADIPTDVTIHPYDKVSEYIAKSEHIAVGVCYCRHHGELIGNPCSKPKDVCMAFGPQAKYVAERGFARLVSRKEALEVLNRSEEAGLIHCSSNTGKYINFMCNCCDCHCGIIQSMKRGVIPMGAVSSFIVAVDEDACNGCGTCIDRCQMDALTLDGTMLVRDVRRCIGCGLCISVCPTEALKLELRRDAPVPPHDQRELNAAMISSLQQNK